MIIQTGMRTDIPAFYTPWFLNRLRAGFVLVRNPYDASAVTRYRLTPDVVDLIGFCTKNPQPMLPHMDMLRPFGQYWFVTITPYGPDIEPHVPPKAQVMESFRRLSDVVGPDCMGWRYDPILVNERYTVDRHLEAFGRMAKTLSGATRTAVVSFIDLYAKVRRNFPEAKEVALAKGMARIGREYGMTVKACAEGGELVAYGVDCGGCMTVSVYEKVLRSRLRVPGRTPVRAECACLLGGDIGAYHTCGHLCRYCYANYDAAAVRANMRAHDPESPFLIGHAMPGDVIHAPKQESWLDPQMMMNLGPLS